MFDGLIGITVAIEAVLVVFERFGNLSARPLGTFGEPNAVAGFLAVGSFFVWHLPVRRVIRFLFFLIVFAGIIATDSRAGVIAFAVVFVGCIGRSVATMKRKRIRNLLVLALGVLPLTTLLFLASPSQTWRSWKFMTRPASPYEDRLLFWRLGFEQVMQRPLLGFGAESGEVVYDRAFLKENVRLINFMVDRSHNIFLDVAMWSGGIGLIVFVWWVGRLMYERWKKGEYALFFTLIAWLFFASLQPLGVTHWVLFILLASKGSLP